MVYVVYDIFLFIGLMIYTPFYLNKQRKNKAYRPDLLQRLGLHRPKLKTKKNKRVLIHSVSVGETRAVIPLIKELKRRCPLIEIYLTTTTGTGRKAAEEIRQEVDEILYFPLDFGIVCTSFLRNITPDIICLTETELWPNFIQAAFKSHIPICIINGRISDRSFKNYQTFSLFITPLIKKITSFCMQSSTDAQRISFLGADREKIIITGNIKFDQVFMNHGTKGLKDFFSHLGLKNGQPVLVAGSTHPGEEEVILKSFKRLLPLFPDLMLILVPRHVERSRDIAGSIKALGIKYLLWSLCSESTRIKGGDVLLIDVIGLLANIYSLASLVFIGGSLIPHGGQNPLEPAFHEKPILFGPHMENFQEISKMLIDQGAAIKITQGTIFETMLNLLRDKKRLDEMGKAGREVVDANQGAAKLTCNNLMKILGENHACN